MSCLGYRNSKNVDSKCTFPDTRVNSLSLRWHEKRRGVVPVQARFGHKLRAARKAKGVSQEKLADLSDLHRTYVSSCERGERNVSLVTVERFAKALKVKMSELMPD
jgi:ribosome-binding protein aMBF1 (putative translation factor)